MHTPTAARHVNGVQPCSMVQIESRTDELLSRHGSWEWFGGRRAAAPTDLAAVQRIVQEHTIACMRSASAVRVGRESQFTFCMPVLYIGHGQRFSRHGGLQQRRSSVSAVNHVHQRKLQKMTRWRSLQVRRALEVLQRQQQLFPLLWSFSSRLCVPNASSHRK